MAEPSRREIVRMLVADHGRTFSEEVGAGIRPEKPSALFRLLVLSLLMSARIRASIAVAAARALFEAGWTTPRKMRDAGWEARTKALNRSGYARYDESTSRMLGDTCERLLAEYGGDLRRLREAAERDPSDERRRLKAMKGLGDVGVDIFMREAQLAWEELYPCVDRRSREVASKLGLPAEPRRLAALVDRREDLPRLVAALNRLGAGRKQVERARRAAAEG